MIPKVIHYCWFGKGELPDSVQRCISSWKKYCPDYEIKQWNESNFDIHMYQYAEEAYMHGKYAFVSDVARLEIIKNEGGIYLDTDVELLKNIDSLLKYPAFMAMETADRVATGLGFGATKNHPFIIQNLNQYKDRHFILSSGKADYTSCVTITTDLIHSKYGMLSNHTVNFEELIIFSSDVFCPFNLETDKLTITPETVAIHHYDATWKDKPDKFLKLKIKLRRIIGSRNYDYIKRVLK